jgi:rod shape-determining protein MreD
VVAALLQVTVASRFEVMGAFPNLVLVTVVVVAWTLGPRAGMVLACAGGILLDLMSAGPVGLHALALLPGAYAIGLWSRRLRPPIAVVAALSAAPATVFYSIVLLTAYTAPPEAAARAVLAAAVYNSVLALFACVLVRAQSLGTISRRAQA